MIFAFCEKKQTNKQTKQKQQAFSGGKGGGGGGRGDECQNAASPLALVALSAAFASPKRTRGTLVISTSQEYDLVDFPFAD